MIPLGEQTMIQHVIQAMEPLFGRVLLSVRAPRDDLGVPQVCDHQGAQGPLAGLTSAMAQTTTSWVFAIACDMPFARPPVITHVASLRSGHQAVVPVIHRHPQPLLAFYSCACLPQFRASLASGNYSILAALNSLNVRFVQEDEVALHDPTLHSFFDIDTPSDLLRAGTILNPTTATIPSL